MACRWELPSLQALSRNRISEITLNSIQNATVYQEEEQKFQTERSTNSKRKRSYSGGDGIQGKLQWNQMARDQDAQIQPEASSSTKRASEGETYGRESKRLKLERGWEYVPHDGTRNKVLRDTTTSQDDTLIRYTEMGDICYSLRLYFIRLPHAVWGKYGDTLISNTLERMRLGCANTSVLKKVIEYIFCNKLTSFSTKNIENFTSELDGIVYSNLKHCRRMAFLELTTTPENEKDEMAITLSLQRLRNLQALSLLPPDRYSFHWAIGVVAQHCRSLKTFKVVYNGDLFLTSDDSACLGQCSSLNFLWLFNFGRKSEIKQVSHILRSLPNLKMLFHKELPNAILELTSASESNVDHSQHDEVQTQREQGAAGVEGERAARVEIMLGLERVDLCWHQRGLGYQLVYVPSSYLVKVAQVCPKIKILNLVGPPCLATILVHLPNLQSLVLQQANVVSCLGYSLANQLLNRLTELRLSDVWDVTHDLISAVACGCPNLKLLSVTSSSLEARGELLTPCHQPPFSNLQHVIMVPNMPHGRPALTTPAVWQLGKDLTSYLLANASKLVTLHLQYRDEDLTIQDTPTQRDLENLFSLPRPSLHSLRLEWLPAASPGLVEVITRACPALATLGSITTWPINPHQCAALIARYYSTIDIS